MRRRSKAVLHHSDHGSQYCSEAFQRLLADQGIICSMSRAGNVWDNAAVERFISSMKTERLSRKIYRTRDDARADVFDYIERFYNPHRRHSTLGYESPIAFEVNRPGIVGGSTFSGVGASDNPGAVQSRFSRGISRRMRSALTTVALKSAMLKSIEIH
jgi:putative transposase